MLGADHKERPHSGGRRRRFVQCPVRTFCGQAGGGSSDTDVRTFWCKKLRIFQNLWGVRTDKRGWASAEILWTRGRREFLRICADDLYGWLLI